MSTPTIPIADVLALVGPPHFACTTGVEVAAYIFPSGIPCSLVSLAIARAAGIDVSFAHALVPPGPIADALADDFATAAAMRAAAQDAYHVAVTALPFDASYAVRTHGLRVAAEADARALEDEALVGALAAVYA